VQRADVDARIVDQLSEALVAAAVLVDGLPPHALARTSPCPGWTVLDVVNHLTAVTEKFGRFAAGTRGVIRQLPGDLVGSEPADPFRAQAETAVNAWRAHPEALEAVCVLPFGSFDGATAAGINLVDAVVHSWDIATGAGVEPAMSEDLAGVALRIVDLLVTDEARHGGHYAAAIVPPLGVPGSARLLAATGRLPRPATPAP